MLEVLLMVTYHSSNGTKRKGFNLMYDYVDPCPEKLMEGKGGGYIPRGHVDSSIINDYATRADKIEEYPYQCVRREEY